MAKKKETNPDYPLQFPDKETRNKAIREDIYENRITLNDASEKYGLSVRQLAFIYNSHPKYKRIGGRPPKFQTPEEMQDAVDRYFEKCEYGKIVTIIRKGKPVLITQRIPKTMAGLTLALGFSSRQSLHDYADRGPKDNSDTDSLRFLDVIACARNEVEQDNVEGGMMGEYESKITGLNLASNFKYFTRQEVDVDSSSIDDKIRRLEEKRIKRIEAGSPQIEHKTDSEK